MKVLCPVDCDNAPRKAILRDWTIAWAQGEASAAELLADDVVYEPAAGSLAEGKAAVVSYLSRPAAGVAEHAADRASGAAVDNNDDAVVSGTVHSVPVELHIHHIITHGNTAALNATLLLDDGRRVDYCHIYLFNGFAKTAKLKRITAYRRSGNVTAP